jgi:catalase
MCRFAISISYPDCYLARVFCAGSNEVSFFEQKPQETPSHQSTRLEYGEWHFILIWPRKLIMQFWDFHTNQPESVHALMHLFGSRGIPSSIRRVTGFGVHTFKLVTADGEFRYCKFHFRPSLEITHFSGADGSRMAGANPDFHNQDLWDAIARGNFPVWKLYVQIMEPAQAETYGRGLFDITKVWPHKEFPLIEVGRMTLNENVRYLRRGR